MALQLISAEENACSGNNYPGVALRQEVYRDSTGANVDVAGNDEDVYVKLMLVKRGASGSGSSSFNANGVCSASAVVNGATRYSSGGLNYDFRSSSGRNATGTVQVLWEGWVNVPHDPDGNKTLTYSGSWGGDSNLGSTSVSGSVVLPKITAIPNVPTGVTGTRVTDTQVTVAWTQSHPSNGAATSNQVQGRVNGGAFAELASVSPTTSVSLTSAANQKLEYRVRATNAAGSSAYSAVSPPTFTSPAAPTGVAAAKVDDGIQVTWTPHVAFLEHEHVIEHGVDVAGVITWDASALAAVPAGTSSFTHAAPDPADRHVYRVRARNTDTGALTSAAAQSNVVQLLTAPAKPTVPAPPPFADLGSTFRFAWVHNAIDTTPQTKYQLRYSLDGGATWATTTAKTASADQFYDVASGTFAAGDAVTFEVRTKGTYDAGGDADASYSPWSDPVTVIFQSAPVATILAPPDAGTVTQAALTVVLGFSQAEGAAFVTARIRLYEGSTLLEERTSTTLAGTLLATRVVDGSTYTVTATVTDSNGLVSAEAASTFDVDYTEPVPAIATATYLADRGRVQLALTLPPASGSYVDATSVSVDRSIDGEPFESVIAGYPAAASLTFLDTTPQIHGLNLYRITTTSADGATSVVELELPIDENEWAFMTKGAGHEIVIRFQLAPGEQATPAPDRSLFKAAGRRRPIAQYSAATGNFAVSGTGALAVDSAASTPREVEDFLLIPSTGCYRSPSGRRIFGDIAGSTTGEGAELASFAFTITETE